MSEYTHTHACGIEGCAHPEGGFGCFCICGAVYHNLGWQMIKILDPPVYPSAVTLEETAPEFDVEEYRADLTSRYESLLLMAERQREGETWPFHATNRLVNKAVGLQMALDLLPRRTQ